MLIENDGGAWLQLAGAVAGAVIGGAGTLLGGWFATRTQSKDQRRAQAEAYQLRIWMELQDALEGIDNALADGFSSRVASQSTVAPRSIALRTRILRARIVDSDLIRMTGDACKEADACVASRGLDEFNDLRTKFLSTVDSINGRINALLVEARSVD